MEEEFGRIGDADRAGVPSGLSRDASQAKPLIPCAWRPLTGRWEAGEALYIAGGRIRVARAEYSGVVSRDDPQKYAAHVGLPGLKHPKCKAETMAEAKTFAERTVQAWFRAAQGTSASG